MKFKKGQTVYFANMHIASITYDVKGKASKYLCMVIERTIDSCGKKRMTFQEHGQDSLFGKSAYLHHTGMYYFESSEEAFDYLHQCKTSGRNIHVHREVMSDRDFEWHTVAKQWLLDNGATKNC